MTHLLRIGILGGTFDPIHNGHIAAAIEASRALSLDRVMLLPSHVPPHRSSEPRASVFHRFAMAALAAADHDRFEVSDLEVCRSGLSYTSQTLEHLHASGLTAQQLFFILGADAFADIHTWHDYPRILSLATFAIVARPGYALVFPPEPASALRSAHSDPMAQAFSPVYANTPDVSATDIRRRVAAGESIAGLVPASVEAHISRNRLYSTVAVNTTA